MALEYSLIMPLLLLTFLILFDIAQVLNARSQFSDAVYATARAAAQAGGPEHLDMSNIPAAWGTQSSTPGEKMKATLQMNMSTNQVVTLNPDSNRVEVDSFGPASECGDTVVIVATYKAETVMLGPISAIMGGLPWDNAYWELQAFASVRCEVAYV